MPDLFALCEATWPPADQYAKAGWIFRNGAGGGQRVCATTAQARGVQGDLDAAEQEMKQLDQALLFQIRPGEDELDAALAARGYQVRDPVYFYTLPLFERPEPSAHSLPNQYEFPPSDAVKALWKSGGIGPARIDIMERAAGPKTVIVSEHDGQIAGCAFVAMAENHAMLHALEVSKQFRRQGRALNIMRSAIHWAHDLGAESLSVAVTQQNAAANALYTSLRMRIVEQYHYRLKPAA